LFSNRLKSSLFLLLLFTFLVLGAQSAESSGKTVMHLGSFKLTSSPAVVANNSSMNNSSINGTSLNNSSANNTSINNSMSNVPIKTLDEKPMDTSAPLVPAVDLSHYGMDRKNKSLTGYRNIMYPMGESSGFTASTASGGGGGCGCGG
jgi:hypothetical protein